jgi:peptide-methionine (S)-S-oxide reductase
MRVRAFFFSVALAAAALTTAAPALAAPQSERVVLAGGCFWGMQAVFERLKGVTNTTVGFAGGAKMAAHYETVSTGTTGHAESVAITFDPQKISFQQLLDVYFTVAHDPTEFNRQGPDDGTQYRSEIFYTTAAQRATAEATIRKLTDAHAYPSRIVTLVAPLDGFYRAEDYHQHYYDKNPDDAYIVANDKPKVAALRTKFAALVKG